MGGGDPDGKLPARFETQSRLLTPKGKGQQTHPLFSPFHLDQQRRPGLGQQPANPTAADPVGRGRSPFHNFISISPADLFENQKLGP
jgi:hypothetical protein